MKLFSLFTGLLFATNIFAQQPISINNTDMPIVGNSFINITDNYPQGISEGLKGVNRFWNFSTLVQDKKDTALCVAPNTTPYNNFNNSSNLAITNNDTNYLYFNSSANNFKTAGSALYFDTIGAMVITTFNPAFDLYKFPTNYENKFAGSYAFTQDINLNGTDIRIEFTSNYVDTIDAWGIVQTPLGYYEALRQKRVDRTRTVIKALPPLWLLTVSDTRDTTFDYNWLSKESKLALIDFAYDSNNVISGVTYSTRAPKPIARFTYSNTGNNFQFNNATYNTNGTTYSWNFGDGSNTVTTTSPQHTFSQAGTFNVCLTATNSIGSSTYCENVTISQSCLNSTLSVTIDSVLDNACAGALSGWVYITASGGATPYTYNWSNNSTDEDIIYLPGGTYSVTVTDDDGCVASQSATVTEPSALQINVDNVAPGATVGSVSISVTGGTQPYDYLWSPGNETTEDVSNLPCNNQYTIVVTDANFCAKSEVAFVECLVSVNDFDADLLKVYPNPTNDIIYVETKNDIEISLSIFNSIGENIFQKNIIGKDFIDVREFSKGIYFINIVSENKVSQKKIVVH